MRLTKSFSLSIILALSLTILFPIATYGQSNDLTVTPIVVDEKAKARDILKQSITITNSSNRKLNLYPYVNDVDVSSGTEQFVSAQKGSDRADSLANWIELSRGVIDLSPGETREIPFVIRVNMNAVAGTYHADISFYEGSTLTDAQAKNPLAVVTVNTEVQADIKETMQLNKFITDNFFFSGDDVLFNYQLENIGNQELKPKGEIRIYDRKGKEVASIPVNPEGKTFTPEEAAQLASAWSAAEGFGKFKAFLNIDYGNNQSGTLQDTIFFWIIPWQQLLAIFAISLIAIVVSALYFHRWLEHRHMQKFALAGMAAGAMQAPPGMLVPPAQKPIVPLMPAPPAETPMKEKKGWFTWFKRNKKEATEDAIIQATVTEAQARPQSDQQAPTPTPMVQVQPTQQLSNTIDLSSAATPASMQPRREGHVINLKGDS